MALKLVGGLAIVFAIFYILTSPHQAHDLTDHLAHFIGHWIAKIAKGLRSFINSFT